MWKDPNENSVKLGHFNFTAVLGLWCCFAMQKNIIENGILYYKGMEGTRRKGRSSKSCTDFPTGTW